MQVALSEEVKGACTVKKLLNLTNFPSDCTMIQNDADCLESLLQQYGFDGIEMMFCRAWDPTLHRPHRIGGCHLMFYPNWLDFWYQDEEALLADYGDWEGVKKIFGTTSVDEWVESFGRHISAAGKANPPYMVFHVANVRYREVYTWDFHYDDQAVVDATLALLVQLAPYIPQDTWLLLENLWWPGMTLVDRDLTEHILTHSPHPKTGIMLDTGHLLSTNQDLRSEEDGLAYLYRCMDNLGDLRKYIKGIHLHQSLSGQFLADWQYRLPEKFTMMELGKHVNRIDYHAPWTNPGIREFVDYISPEWLVFEFLQRSLLHWQWQVETQNRAMGWQR